MPEWRGSRYSGASAGNVCVRLRGWSTPALQKAVDSAGSPAAARQRERHPRPEMNRLSPLESSGISVEGAEYEGAHTDVLRETSVGDCERERHLMLPDGFFHSEIQGALLVT